ncbi:metallophosphoesterase [Brevibacillus laterosporus]|uniref:metallophosphoesterase family protein n=1 Tax=Brevibacillus laterosporus TaxID=1465 RepID=UPI0003816F7F|nr:metallophosphoesterase [Brevibacillus laterosporus]ATO50530.1 YfcE family phosphodiesterase [Brevibacillus laterosporus DSM 25]MBG9771545.1 phosphoesterase [Brevibacillus laterosporus]MBG9802604.1 phosphoesterase [Brevibacillus laterosporus]MCR8937281.1 metallophosphoesterase [Brevibacillus laterosporus]MCZ0839920.1 metallophosphoesterase [Brevibacillus laterosporus]
MSILIISDTHGQIKEVQDVVDRHPADIILHCGDFCVDQKQAPFSKMKLVQGNCDFEPVAKDRVTRWKDLIIYQTHGHLYDVKSSLMKLHYRAEEVGANVVLFGHSHFPVCEVERDILFINPGSLMMPRGFRTPTYAVLDQIGTDDFHIKVRVRFNDRQGQEISERGGQFLVRR